MTALYPLRFRPIFRRYLWGGRRLKILLDKPIGPGDDWAESWEVSDHGDDQSVVEFGPLAGTTLGQLVTQLGGDLLGPRAPHPRFPLLLKFLDAMQTSSVQVHPDDARAAKLTPPDLGKTEAWLVIDALPGSTLYAGLKPGVDRDALTAAIRQGRCQESLHSFQPSVGDCIFLPAGAVHALGAGLLVVEIQQSSDVTYRLFDWNRLGTDGKPRPLHVEAGLDAVDFGCGPVTPQKPLATDRPQAKRLVDCDRFVWDRWEFDAPTTLGGDQRCHIIAVLEGSIHIEGDPAGTALGRGGTVLLPACLEPVRLNPEGRAVFVDACLP